MLRRKFAGALACSLFVAAVVTGCGADSGATTAAEPHDPASLPGGGGKPASEGLSKSAMKGKTGRSPGGAPPR